MHTLAKIIAAIAIFNYPARHLFLPFLLSLHRNSSTLNFCFETEECLLFDLICDTGKYEVRENFFTRQMPEKKPCTNVFYFYVSQVRHYESVKWVTTEEETYFLDFAAISAFRRLFNYIKGTNDTYTKLFKFYVSEMKTQRKMIG